jgi:hypothetical protein
MKKGFSLVFFILCAQWVVATHIVGGEFEITHVQGDTYLFRQIQYFDVVNGEPLAKDNEIRASIFRKRGNVFIRTVTMRYRTESLVQYTNPICTDDRLITNRIVYSTEVTLDSAAFSDPEGYYMVWERCCRNNIITNIVLPDQTGQTFFIEFPAIRKNGEEFRNSSPQLFPPLSDYACVGRFYYVDFRGYDPDGDSLVYSLNPPLNSSQYDPLPVPTPAPHNKVTWKPGISDTYQIPGIPTLTINSNGFLTVVPSEEGLFVFSVKCEEYRDGVKIGTVLRDFQLFVIDCPAPGNKPELQVKAPDIEFFVSQLDTIRLKAGDERCFDFRVKDKDGGETIRLRAEAVNFKENIQSILSASIGFLPNTDDTLGIRVCLPECPYLQDKPFVIDIIAEDNTCPLPLMDTLRLIVLVEPPPNKPPVFTLPQQDEMFLSFFEWDTINLEFMALDPNDDKLWLEVDGLEFDTELFGIVIDTIEDSAGKMHFRLWWDTDCKKYPFAMKNDFQLKFFVEDADLCMWDNRDSVIVNIHVELPDNNAPVLTADGQPVDKEIIIVAGGNLSIDLKATDADSNDLITLTGSGIGFNLKNVGLNFVPVSGKQELNTLFNWKTYCDLLNHPNDGSYNFIFFAEDADKCKVPNADTLLLNITVIPPDNTAPELLINNELITDTLWVTAGDQLDLDLTGLDSDGDSIVLEMINRSLLEDVGASFNNKSGFESLSSQLNWQTDCSDLSDGYQAAVYTFIFILQDFACAVPKNDMREITVVVEDRSIDLDFFVPNVFTPNQQDRINETYMVPDLPVDNCEKQFQYIIIYNRWGKEVFRSEDKNFQWTGEGYSTGVYYYILSYTGLDIKGTVSLLR